jgi:hypothetical protein
MPTAEIQQSKPFYFWPRDEFAGGSFVTYRLTLDGRGSECDWMIPGTELDDHHEQKTIT